MEKIKEISKEKPYSEQLEERLSAGLIVDRLMDEFNHFEADQKPKGEGEQFTLRNIRKFLHENKELVQNICKDSRFDQWNCLTLTTLTCMLAGRQGLKVTVGKPKDVLERFINVVIIKNNGEIFQLVVSPLESKEFVKMDADAVTHRFRRYRPLVKLGRRGCEELAELFPNELPKLLRKKMNKQTRPRH